MCAERAGGEGGGRVVHVHVATACLIIFEQVDLMNHNSFLLKLCTLLNCVYAKLPMVSNSNNTI